VEENTLEDIERLKEAGLPVFVTYPRTVASAIDELETLAEMMGAAERARESLDDARQELAKAPGERVRVFCPIWRRPWMTIGADTYIHDMLRVCGGDNVFADSLERYPEVTLDEVRAREPDVILLPDEPYPFEEKHKAEVIEALGPVRIYLMDGKDLCWYGPRIGPAIRSLRAMFAGNGEL
jgi:ABC-type Fe3+-hydroxamate transport system substrate-binding protein